MHMHAYNSFTNNTFDCMHSLLRKSDLKENILHNTKIQTLNLKVHNITKKYILISMLTHMHMGK